MKGLTLTVTQLNEYVRRSFASDPMLQGLCLTGELSNLKKHSSGHWYFTLKDEEAAINCAMFRQAAFGLKFRPENGQRVRVFGSVGLYIKTGAYQFYADAMEPDGIGDLYLRFEALKRKLMQEGLFDASLKKQLPLLPKGIGIITSKTGAVVHDIARVTWRRFPGMPLYLLPVKVQGDGAAQEIAHALRIMDKLPEAEVIIVGRGGGSMEDLWAFNEEVVARAIAACKTPVVSAVGHETDFTIADMVADLRAATPSAAAEMAVPQHEAFKNEISVLYDDITQTLERQINQKKLVLTMLQQRLMAASPSQRSERLRASLAALNVRMDNAVKNALQVKKNSVEHALLRVRASGPMETMKRGYAVVMKNEKLVHSAAAVQPGEAIRILMADGSIEAAVHSTQIETDNG